MKIRFFQKKTGRLFTFFILSGLIVSLSGCASRHHDLERVNQEQAAAIQALNEEIARLNHELDMLMSVQQDELSKVKTELEHSMKEELQAGSTSLSMQSRGLVVTVLDRVLFDSGKAALKASSLPTLDKVVQILLERVKDNRVFIEGHTDNVPIRYSNWRSNWELSTARATEVVHYFVDNMGIEARRIAAVGYGEYHPVVDNDTEEGREKNRRVEIVISPQKVTP